MLNEAIENGNEVQDEGSLFLVNKKGKIMAINPTAYEVEQQLKKLL